MAGTIPRESVVSTPVSGVTPSVIAVDSAESRYPVTSDTPNSETAVDAGSKIAIVEDRTALDPL